MVNNHRGRCQRAPPFHHRQGLGNHSHSGLQRAGPSFQSPNIQWQAQTPLPCHPHQFPPHWQPFQSPVVQPPTVHRQALEAPLLQPPTTHFEAIVALPALTQWQAPPRPALPPTFMQRQAARASWLESYLSLGRPDAPTPPPIGSVQPLERMQRQAAPAPIQEFSLTVAPPVVPTNDNRVICQDFRRTGICKYGTSCKKRHLDEHRMTSYPHIPEAKECKHFIDFGFCARGLRCRCHHPTDKIKPAEMAPEVTRTGFARRPGMVQCPHYQHRRCFLRAYCKFDHPDE